MEEISEKSHHAGWLGRLEHELWDIVEAGEPTRYGDIEIDGPLIARLRDLRDAGYGWWAWSDEYGDAVFVRLDDWRHYLEETKRAT